MTRTADIVDEFASTEIRTLLTGKKCWCAFSTFASTVGLDMGRKIRRERPLRHVPATAKNREYMGEAHVVIWCSWRLEHSGVPLVSSDADGTTCETQLRKVVGRSVRSVDVSSSWDLRILFSGGFSLYAFPDHVGNDADFDGNWELWTPDQAYLIGTDLSCEVMDREENRPMHLPPRRERWQANVSRQHRKT